MASALALPAALLLAAVVANLMFVLAGVALSPWAKVMVEKLVWGTGPLLLSGTVRGAAAELRLVPISASLSFVGSTAPDEGAPPPPPPRAPLLPWFEAPAARRALVLVVAPRLAALAVASAALGTARATRSIASGLVELFAGAIGPFSAARSLLDEGAAVLGSEGFAVLSALALGKLVAMGLLGLPADMAFAVSRRHHQGVMIGRLLQMLLGLGLALAWAAAWVGWAAR